LQHRRAAKNLLIELAHEIVVTKRWRRQGVVLRSVIERKTDPSWQGGKSWGRGMVRRDARKVKTAKVCYLFGCMPFRASLLGFVRFVEAREEDCRKRRDTLTGLPVILEQEATEISGKSL
jgi:hypothetical protein